MQKFRPLSIVILFVIFILFESCKSKTNFKIGFMLPNITKERYPKERDYLTAKVNTLGGEVLWTDARNDDQLQITQAEELFDKGIKALVIIAVNSNSAGIIARIAQKNHVPVIAYERMIANCEPDYYISFDNVRVGEQIAQYAVNLKSQGTYIIFGGDKSDLNAIWVNNGMMKVLNPLTQSGKIKLIYNVFIEEWSKDNAKHEMQTFLNLYNELPDVVLSVGDNMTAGIIEAIENNDAFTGSYPIITGQNGELKALQNIVNGKQKMTIYKSIRDLAEQAAILAVQCAKREKIGKPPFLRNNGQADIPSFLIDPIVIDSGNIKDAIIAKGIFKESDIYSAN
jgi:D-xylose transport system substrate-binding protein